MEAGGWNDLPPDTAMVRRALANELWWFGATSPAQIAENVAALEVDAATIQRIAA
jgi:hypothetical protein